MNVTLAPMPASFDPSFMVERIRGKSVLIWRGKGLEIARRDMDRDALKAAVWMALEHDRLALHSLNHTLRADRHDIAQRRPEDQPMPVPPAMPSPEQAFAEANRTREAHETASHTQGAVP